MSSSGASDGTMVQYDAMTNYTYSYRYNVRVVIGADCVDSSMAGTTYCTTAVLYEGPPFPGFPGDSNLYW